MLETPDNKKDEQVLIFLLEATTGLEPVIRVLQTLYGRREQAK